MTTTDIQLSQADIERLPHYQRQTTSGEYSAACPFCNAGEDRFRFWPDKGNYWCRRCEAKGFVAEADSLKINPAQYEAWQRAKERREAKLKQRQLSALDQIAQSPNADNYHNQMMERDYWYSQGLSDQTINKYRLGYCPACPTYQSSPSWTIPVYYQNRLWNIRHRLARPNGKGKYRPEIAGLPSTLFNADLLAEPGIIVLVEGEVKAMVLCQHDFNAVGIPGANNFKEKWVNLFENIGLVYVALDPDAGEEAERIGSILAGAGIDTRICQIPVKPDDFIVKYGGTKRDLFQYLVMGRKVKVG